MDVWPDGLWGFSFFSDKEPSIESVFTFYSFVGYLVTILGVVIVVVSAVLSFVKDARIEVGRRWTAFIASVFIIALGLSNSNPPSGT